MKDYYKILELSFGASSSEVKTAYRRLAFKFHPDKNLNNQYAEEKFKEITEAYSVISNENRRIIYHAEYNDFLNNKYINRIPPVASYRKRYYHPTDIPKQPRGPASNYEDNLNGLRVALLVGVVATVIFLFAKSIIQIRENERATELEFIEQNKPKVYTDFEESDTITTDRFYQLLSHKFKHTKDSVLLNSNIDSLKHIFDSLRNEYRLKH